MAKRKRGGSTSTRSTKSKAKKSAASSAPVEIVEEGAGEGIDSGIIIMTTVLLFMACIMADMAAGKYGEGVIF